MNNISKNVASNGFIGSTVNVGYGSAITGTVGSVYTTNTTAGQFSTNGSNKLGWPNPNCDVMIIKQDPASLEVKGRMVVNGRDLEDRLNTIEKVLMIPERDLKLEKKHPKLKRLYDEYIAALGKYRTFEAIKGDDNETA